ncbi:conjugal transfer protein TraD [Sphingobium cloacae]|nr:conjugal transfer protein TraD [Sphingobium cloacae]
MQTLATLSRLKAARNRHLAARARADMRDWQVQRRERTKHLIELGGLVVKAGIVELVDDDRAALYGALLWMADMLRSEDGVHARVLWKRRGKRTFEGEQLEAKEDRAIGR